MKTNATDDVIAKLKSDIALLLPPSQMTPFPCAENLVTSTLYYEHMYDKFVFID